MIWHGPCFVSYSVWKNLKDFIRLFGIRPNLAEDADEVAAHGAAYAAVIHLEDFFLGVDSVAKGRIHAGWAKSKKRRNNHLS